MSVTELERRAKRPIDLGQYLRLDIAFEVNRSLGSPL
jgi:hypothetical protein